MEFVWDENKRRINLEKHGFDFLDTEKLSENRIYTVKDDRFDYGEERYFTLGLLFGRIVALSHTESDQTVRVISLRKANKYEQQKYIEEIANRLGED